MGRITVAVPVHNEQLYIHETLHSLTLQTYTDFDVVVYDNCSTDGTGGICQNICSQHQNFSYLRRPENVGAMINFRDAYKFASSEYFMWLGGHDLISKNFIEEAVTALDAHPEFSLAGGNVEYIDENGDREQGHDSSVYSFSKNKWIRYLQSVMHLQKCTMVNFLFRRALIEDMDLLPIAGMDHVILSRMLWHGNVYFSPTSMYSRRMFARPEGSYMQRITGRKEQVRNYSRLIEQYTKDFNVLMNDHSFFSFFEKLYWRLARGALFYRFRHQIDAGANQGILTKMFYRVISELTRCAA